MLSWSAARCMTTTKAIPVSAGVASKNACRAAMPPADPPSPTIGSMAKLRDGTASSMTSASSSSAWSGAGSIRASAAASLAAGPASRRRSSEESMVSR